MGAGGKLPTPSPSRREGSSPTPSPSPWEGRNLRIVALGDLVYDVLVQSDEEELSQESDITARIVVRPGGSAANFAVQAARLLGAGRVSFISKVGRDDSGAALVQSLEREGVQPHVAIEQSERPTGTVLVFVNRSGRRTMVTDPGASRVLTVAELEANADILANADAFHLTSYSLFTDPPRSAALRACQLTKQGGALISLDPSSHHLIETLGRDRYIALAQAAAADIFLPNLDEGRLLSGEYEPEAVARALHHFAPIVALKLGANGCLVSQRGGDLQHIPAVPHIAVDTTGAGDAFAAALVVGYLHSRDLIAAAQMANEVAAAVVGGLGAR
jgi:ribokinase